MHVDDVNSPTITEVNLVEYGYKYVPRGGGLPNKYDRDDRRNC